MIDRVVRIRRALVVFFALSASALAFGQGAPIVGSAPVVTQASSATPLLGSTFTVDVAVDLTGASGTIPGGSAPAALTAFRVPITFDASRLELTAIGQGSDPSFRAAGFDATAIADANASGRVTITATQAGTGPAPSGIVSVATLTFRARSAGAATIAAQTPSVSLASAIQVSSASLFGPAAIPVRAIGGGVVIQTPPLLRVTMQAGPSPATPNGVVIYTIHCENAGGSPATGTVVTVAVPSGVTFVAASNGGTHDAGTVRWQIGELAAAASFDATFAVTVNAPTGTTIQTSPATATATGLAPVFSAAVAINVNANAPVKPGMIVAATSYNYNMGRIYDVTTGTPVLFARLPSAWVGPLLFTPNGRLIAVSDAHDGSLYDISSGGDLTAAAPFLKKLGTNITGLARDPSGNYYLVQQNPNARVKKVSPTGAVTELPPLFQYPGSVIVDGTTLYVSEGATGTVKRIDLSTNAVTTFASGFTTATHHFSGQMVRTNNGRLFILSANGGGTGVFDITAGGTFSAATPVTARNAFRIDVNQLAADSGNHIFLAGNGSGAVWRSTFTASTGAYSAAAIFATGVSDTESIAIYPVPNVPLLALGATASANPAVSTRQLVYTLTLENRGGVAATNGTLTVTLPAGVTYASSSNSGTHNAGVVTWPFATIGASSTTTRTITVNVTAAPGSTLPATPATIAATGIATVETQLPSLPVVAPPDLRIDVVGPPSVPLNSHITYTISYRNLGGSASTNTVIDQTVPANSVFVSSERGVLTATNVRWTLGTLAPGAGGTVTFVVRAGGTPPTTIVNNNCRISSTEITTPVVAPAISTSVTAASPLVVSVVPAPNPVVPGTQINTAVRYRNTSTTAANNVTVTFPIPPNGTFLSASGGGALAGNAVVWTIPTLAANADVTVRASFRISGPAGTKTMVAGTTASAEWAPAQGVPALIDVRPYPAILGPGVVLSVMSYNESTNIGRVTALTSPTAKSFFAHADSRSGSGVDAWAGPLAVAANGHVYIATEAFHGTVWDITVGGDLRTGATPFCTIPPNPGSMIADTAGNLYVINYSTGAQVRRINANGETTILASGINGGGGLALDEHANILYFSEGATGIIKKIDLATGTVSNHATGFPGVAHHYSAQLALTSTKKLFVLWGNETANIGLWDITNPGSYTGVPAASRPATSSPMRLDINQIGVAPNDDLFIAGNGRDNIVRAVFANGTYGPMTPWATSTGGALGDNEGLALYPSYALKISGAASVSHAMRDDPVTFTFTYSNASVLSTDNVAIEVPLPAGFTFASASAGGVLASNVVRWTIGTLAPGAGGTVSISGAVTGLEGTTVSMSGYKASGDARATAIGTPVNVLVDFPLGVEAVAEPEPVVAGQTITYTVRFENLNPTAATNVVVRSAVPVGATFLTASDGGVMSGGIVSWTIGNLPGGGSGSRVFTVRADVPPAVTNAGTSVQSTEFGNRSGVAVTTTVLPLPVKLMIAASAAPNPVTAGTPLTYTIQYANNGGSPAASAVLRAEVPPSTTFESSTGGGTLSGGFVVWQLGTVGTGASGSVSFAARVGANAAGSITNDDIALASASQSVSAAPVVVAVVAPPPPAPLAVTLTADPSPVTAGELLTYRITVANPADVAATDVVVTNALPAGTSLVSTTGPATSTSTAVQWSLGTLQPGESIALAITVRVSASAGSAIFNNGATATTTGRAGSQSGAVQTNVIAPAAALQLSLSGPPTVIAGGSITYLLAYSNGSGIATTASVVAPIPAGTTLVALSPGGSLSNGVPTWPLGALAAGSSGTVTLTVSAGVPAGSTITNTGSALRADNTPSVSGGTLLTDVVSTPPTFSGTLATDKSAYLVPEVVKQIASLTYASGGSGLASGLTATLVTTNAAETVVASWTQAIAAISVGATLPVTFDWPTTGVSSGSYTVTYVVTDGAGDELVRQAATVTVSAPDGAKLTGTIAPTNSPVPIGNHLVAHVAINNPSAVAYTPLPLEVALLDQETLEVRKSVALTLTLAANGAAQADVNVPTDGLAIGTYSLWLTTSVGGGRLLDTDEATTIAPRLTLAPPSQSIVAGAGGTLTLTMSSAPTQPVAIALTSSHPNIAGVPASVTLPAGATSVDVAVSGVSAGGPATITAKLPPSHGGASASATVTVVLTGDITATLQVYHGENVSFGVSIRNGGSAALTDAPFAIEIRNALTGALVDTIPFTATIAPAATFTNALTHSSTPLAFQKYEARLIWNGLTPPYLLDSAVFEVLEPPPLRLEAVLGSTPRVVIWANCSPGNSGQPCTAVPPPFLTQTLTAANIPYVVVGEQDDFLSKIRSGAFSAAIIDQAGASEAKIAAEYIHDIHAGIGLLFVHSSPNAMPKLAPALGMSFGGKLQGPATVELLATPFTTPGPLTLNGDGVKITLAGAKAAANLSGTTTPAISYHEFGLGKVVAIPFDLELTQTTDVAKLIVSAVRYVSRTTAPPLAARSIIPIRFTVTTPPGSDVPVTLNVTLPSGAAVIAAAPPLTSTSPLRWSATLPGNTNVTFDLWIRLPDAAGTIAVTAAAGLTGGPPVVTKTLDLVVAADAAAISTQLQAELTALKNAARTNPDVKAINDAIAALTAIGGSTDAPANVTRVLTILDKLATVSLDTTAARASADRLLLYWQSRVGV